MKYIFLSLLAFTVASPAFAQTSREDVVKFDAPVPLTIKTADGEHNFKVEEAKTHDQQARGMMFRASMEADSGMLFEFEPAKVATIWMKNTSIPLDILFVRSNGKILKIEHSHQPYTLRSASSEAPVAAVVELQGGRSKELGIRPGDVVVHPYFQK